VELQEAEDAAQEAIGIAVGLATGLPAVHTGDLRSAGTVLADAMDALGRTGEAAAFRTRLAETIAGLGNG